VSKQSDTTVSVSAAPKLSPLVAEVVALLGGLVSAVIIALPMNTFLNFIAAETVFVAPLVEEPTKAVGVAFLALNYPHAISTKKRGIILGGLAGLGFAFTENLLYATMPDTNVVARALLPVPMHVMASGVAALGFVYLAQKRIETRSISRPTLFSNFKLKNVFSLLAVATIIHMQYNVLSFFGYSGSLIGLVISGLLYYRLGRSLPPDLRFYTLPGPAKLLASTIHVRVVRPLTPPSRTIAPIPTPVAVETGQEKAYCINCAQRISHGEAYCDHCGASQL
jgi:hypothetical protein